jgi:hypothetical protein
VGFGGLEVWRWFYFDLGSWLFDLGFMIYLFRQGQNVDKNTIATDIPSLTGRVMMDGYRFYQYSVPNGTTNRRGVTLPVPTGHEIEPLHAIYFACLYGVLIIKNIIFS